MRIFFQLLLYRSLFHSVIFHNPTQTKSERASAFLSLRLQLRTSSRYDNIKQFFSLYRREIWFPVPDHKIIQRDRHVRFYEPDVRLSRSTSIAISMNRVDSQHNKTCLWGLAGDPVAVRFRSDSACCDDWGFFDEIFGRLAEDCDYTVRLVRANCPILFEKDLS